MKFFAGAREDDADPITDVADAESYVAEASFSGDQFGRVGVELEWLVYYRDDHCRVVSAEEMLAVVLPSKTSGSLSTEPGGQLELSSIPADLETCISESKADMSSLRERFRAAGLELVGVGVDPCRPPTLKIDVPRYNAMVQAFDLSGKAGRRMLCSTASVQVCVDAAQSDSVAVDFRTKWQSAYALGPILVACFANSPIFNGRVTGWRSAREATWMDIDPSRTGIPSMELEPQLSWARYALEAFVICIRNEDGRPWTAPQSFTFHQWIASGWPRRPNLGDLRYHLTTLFPPVRPRGYLELRMIDAQTDDNWIVAAAVVHALLDDSKAVDAVRDIASTLSWPTPESEIDTWRTAAREGLTNPRFSRAAMQCFEVALSSLARTGTTSEIINLVELFADRYVFRGRCPADDLTAIGTADDGDARL